MPAVEFRLYYDNTGNVICYTCEKPAGTYIVIDAETYAACRMDIKVIDGKITKNTDLIFSQLVQVIDGVTCTNQDISIVVTDNYQDVTMWDVQIHKVAGV